jgi:hypothetical protein
MMATYEFSAEVWIWPGKAAWHFISLPQDISNEIKTMYQGLTRGWGSLPVHVTIGNSKWQTSIFPDSKSNCYILPVKVAARKAEGIVAGQSVHARIDIAA